MINFDEQIDRSQYPTMKWNKSFLAEHFGNENAIPMSVADMDLKSPSAVIEQLQKRVAHGIYGYENKPDSYYTALLAWYKNRYGWDIDHTHLEPCPSIMNAVSVLINQHSNSGDGVILQSPVFFEFRMVIKSNDRIVVKNPLKLVGGRYEIDFADLEAKTAVSTNKILILCNPHNPFGRVWTKEELTQIANICTRNNTFVIADEIHGDFAFPPHRYTPYLTVSNNGAACISPAKTFNIAGMVDAMVIIPNEIDRQQFHDFAHRYQTNKTNVFATLATETAYREGGVWLDELITYLQGNVDLVRTFLQENDLNISLIEPEGTFLLWLDFRGLQLDAKRLQTFLAQEAQIALGQGYWFGGEGAGFARMSIACPRATVQHALDNLATAVQNLET